MSNNKARPPLAGGTGDGAILDGASSTEKATVLAGSTPAAPTDNPLVVALHPLSPVVQGLSNEGTIPWAVRQQLIQSQQLFGAVHTLSAPGDSQQVSIFGPTHVYVEVSGTYAGASLAFTYERYNGGFGPLVEPIQGQRIDTGVSESTTVLPMNGKQTWRFAVGIADLDGASNGTGLGPVWLRITASAIASGTVRLNATTYDATTPVVGATTIAGSLPAGTNVLGHVVVDAAPASDANTIAVGELLRAILVELRLHTIYLQAGLNVRDEPETLRREIESDPAFTIN